MENTSKKIPVVLILSVIIIVLLALCAFLISKIWQLSAIIVESAHEVPTTIVDNDWKTYTNTDLSIMYPSQASLVEKTDKVGFDLAAFKDVKTIHSAAITLDSKKGECSSVDSNYPNGLHPNKAKDITTRDGILFTYYESGDAGAGQREDIDMYKVNRNGKCYEAVLAIEYSSPGNYGEGDTLAKLTGDNIQAITDTFKKVVSTLKFIN